MRLPSGYGSVTKLSGNRRRPYLVKKTTGWDERGYPIVDIIGYTVTREEGLELLAQYNCPVTQSREILLTGGSSADTGDRVTL